MTHVFPDVATIAALDPETLPMPRSRARALVGLADALASGAVCLHPGADREEAAARLLALPGIGPWTVGYIRMRALSDPDAFPPGDAGRAAGAAAARARVAAPGPDTASGAGLAALALVRSASAVGNARIRHQGRGDRIMNTPFVAAETTAPTCYDIVDSPIGRLLLTGDDQALTGLYMLDTGGHPAAVRADWTRRPGGFSAAAQQLAEYFAGRGPSSTWRSRPAAARSSSPSGPNWPGSPTG